MLLRNLKAVNFLALREAEVRNLPRRGVVGVEGGDSGPGAVLRDLLRFALFGPRGTDVIRPGASFAYVEIELVHPELGPLTLFRGVDRRGTVQASFREPERRTITNGAEPVDRRLSELLPVGAEQFDAAFLGIEPHAPPPEPDLPEVPPPSQEPAPESALEPGDPAGRELLDQILKRPADRRQSLVLALAFSGLAVLLFALLLVARTALGLESPYVSAAQSVAGIVLLFDVWLVIRAWRSFEASGTPAAIAPIVPAPASAPPRAEPVSSPPASPPASTELTPERVREAGARAGGDASRFIVLSGRWPGDADELLRSAGPSVAQVFLLTEPGGSPPGADLKLVVRVSPEGEARLGVGL